MEHPSFNTFCEKYSTSKIGLRRATALYIRQYRRLHKFPVGVRDLNEKYRLIFSRIDEDTKYNLLLGQEGEAGDESGVATYKILVDNWARKKSSGLKGDRNKALLVFYWFCYFVKDRGGAHDRSYAMAIEKSLVWTKKDIKKNELQDARTEQSFDKSKSTAEEISGIDFENISSQIISVYWVDFMGHEKFYFDVDPGHSHGQATFIDHVWTVRLKATGHKIYKVLATRKAEKITISDKIIEKTKLLRL